MAAIILFFPAISFPFSSAIAADVSHLH